jgi:branched-subunit amino acid transport protein AzlD
VCRLNNKVVTIAPVISSGIEIIFRISVVTTDKRQRRNSILSVSSETWAFFFLLFLLLFSETV